MKETKYDKELMEKDPLFAIHKFSLPHIGEEYEKFRILHVGESNYLGQDAETESDQFGIPFFAEKWWNTEYTMEELMRVYPETCWDGDWTRNVIKEFGTGLSDFFDIYKAMGTALLKLKFPEVEPSEKNIREYYYKYFAFTDYYKMPSLYKGKAFNISLNIGRKKLSEEENKKYPSREFNRNNKAQAQLALDTVIEVLDPKVVLVTSSLAMHAYQGKYKDRFLHVHHPSSRRFGYFKQEDLENELKKALQ